MEYLPIHNKKQYLEQNSLIAYYCRHYELGYMG